MSFRTETLHRQIYCELSPFFRYATFENRSLPVDVDTAEVRTKRIYSNCVACNRYTVDLRQAEKAHYKEGAYFCHPCEEKIAEVSRKYTQNTEKEIFEQVREEYLFAKSEVGPKEKVTCIKTVDVNFLNGAPFGNQYSEPQYIYESPTVLKEQRAKAKQELFERYNLEGPLPMPSRFQQLSASFGGNITIHKPFVVKPVRQVPLVYVDRSTGKMTIREESELTEDEKALVEKAKKVSQPAAAETIPPGTYIIIESQFYRVQEKQQT